MTRPDPVRTIRVLACIAIPAAVLVLTRPLANPPRGEIVVPRALYLDPVARRARIEALRARLEPLRRELAMPEPDDWRATFREAEQSFADYLESVPVSARGPRRVLAIQPLVIHGLAPELDVSLLAEFLALHFGLPVRVARAASIEPPRRALKGGFRDQVLASFLRERLSAEFLQADAASVLGVTSTDLWPGGTWNFVFGEASLDGRVAVVSLHRLGTPGTADSIERRSLRRLFALAAHETGHTLSMRHCTRNACVMNGSMSLDETDRTPLAPCPECLAKIAWTTGVDPLDRARRLIDFFEPIGFAEEKLGAMREAALLAQGEDADP